MYRKRHIFILSTIYYFKHLKSNAMYNFVFSQNKEDLVIFADLNDILCIFYVYLILI